MSEPKLLPCPFCGGDDIKLSNNDIPPGYGVAYCYCPACGTDGPCPGSVEQAIAAWNRRSHTPESETTQQGDR